MLFATANAVAQQGAEKAANTAQEFTINLDPTQLTQYGPVLGIVAVLLISFFKLKQQGKGTKWFGTLLAMSVLSVGGWGVSRYHQYSDFSSKADDYVLAAYNAKTPAEAKLQFDRANEYLQKNKMTEGSTAFLYPSPQYNVGDWYKRVELAQKKIDAIAKKNTEKPDTEVVSKTLLPGKPLNQKTPWQKALLNLEVVKQDLDSETPSFVSPEGISTYPNNGNMALWLWGSILSVLLSLGGFIYKTKANW